MSVIHRIRAILGFSTTKINELVAGAKNVQAKIAADTVRFASPVIAVAVLLGLVQAVESLQPAVDARTRGAKALRTTKVLPLVSALEQLVKYVQGLADAAASPAEAEAIVVAAGMKVAPVAVHPKPVLTLKNILPSGTVVASAFSIMLTQGSKGRPTFHWSYSVDGEKTWLSLPSTPLAHTTISGLTPSVTVAVRVAVTVGNQAMGAWTPASTILVQ